MKAIKCEMCNSGDFVKDGEFFVCQSCGTKYTVETIQKMRLEGPVDVTGSTVSIDNSEQVAKHLANARRAKKKEDWEEVEKYYNLVEESDPKNLEAIFYSAYGRAKMSLLSSDLFMRQQAFKVLKKCISILDENYDVKRATENKAAIVSIGKDLASMICGEFVYTYKKNLNGEVVEDNKNETYKLFRALVIAFSETIGNIEKIDDQEYMHETALGLYEVAYALPHVSNSAIMRLILAEKEKSCSLEEIEKEAYKALLGLPKNKSLYSIATAHYDQYLKKKPNSAVGHLGTAAVHLIDSGMTFAQAEGMGRSPEKGIYAAEGMYEEFFDELASAAKCPIPEDEKETVKKYAQWENTHGETLLFYAVFQKNYDVVKFLIEAGADVNHRDGFGDTVLRKVCTRGILFCHSDKENDRIAELLLDAGADPTVANKIGDIPYHRSIPRSLGKIIKQRYPDLKRHKNACYVATCVYGSYDCPQVWTLRRYRDDTLAGTWYGRAFIRFYYLISPTAVRLFGKTGWFQRFFRKRLDRMVKRLNDRGVENTPYRDKKW